MSAASASDTGMMKIMALVLGALVIFTLLFVTVARLLDEGDEGDDALTREALLRRIEPIGQVRTEPLAEAPAEPSAQATVRTAEELAQGACANCHTAGVAGAPKFDDEAAWAARRETGLEALVASVLNGKGAMPARGGSDYSDEEIRRAVQYMAGFEVDEPSSPANSGEDAAGEDAAGEDAAGEDAAGEDAAGEDAAGEDAAGTAESPGDAELIALIGSGQAPANMDDKVKSTAEGLCAGCHVAGVAGAPKLGDTAAWTPRVETGLESLVQTVIQGKGAMPPRGGSDLTDEQIAVAVQYLIALQQP